MFQHKEYFDRIGLKSTPKVDLNFLRELYLCHLRTFVFENLDCLYDREIKIDSESLYNKLVIQKRGGYCFELNVFFCEALKYFGFTAELKLARVFYRGTGINAKTHLTVLVNLDGQNYIADAGFGGPGPEDLLKVELNTNQKVGHYEFVIQVDEKFGYMVKRKTEGEFKNVFAFTYDEVYPADLEMSNFYVSKLPTSAFRNNINICQFNELGRETVFNDTHNIFEKGILRSKKIENFFELKNILEKNFKLSFVQSELDILESKFKTLSSLKV